jgi:hypothetical protein
MRTCLTVELSPGSSLLQQPEMLGYFLEAPSAAAAATTTTTADGWLINNREKNNNNINDNDSTFIIHAKRLTLSHTTTTAPQQHQQHANGTIVTPPTSTTCPSILHPLAAVFVSSTITESALDDFKDVFYKISAAAQKKSSSRPSCTATTNSSKNGKSNYDTYADDDDDADIDDDFILTDPCTRQRLSQRLLSLVHSFLARNFAVKGIVSSAPHSSKRRRHRGEKKNDTQQPQPPQHAPSDIVLLDLQHAPAAAIDEMLQATNCQLVHSGPEAILKILLISQLVFTSSSSTTTVAASCSVDEILHHQHHHLQQQQPSAAAATNNGEDQSSSDELQHKSPSRTFWDIPTCPVCLHRIDPRRLGLPRPENHQLCSKFCPPPNYSLGFQQHQFSGCYYNDHYDVDGDNSNFNGRQHHQRVFSSDSSLASFSYGLPCSQQRLLLPWPFPSYCIACRVIDKYWKSSSSSSGTETGVTPSGLQSRQDIFCYQCSLQETLWVCLVRFFWSCALLFESMHTCPAVLLSFLSLIVLIFFPGALLFFIFQDLWLCWLWTI